MHNHQHPDAELLDRLRAGLLDNQPEEKAALEQHLSGCESCGQTAGTWKQLNENAMGPQVDATDISAALLAARRKALASDRPAAQRKHPLFAYAAAASLVLAVVVGLWTINPGIDTTTMVAGTEQAVPDIYEDLDFYLWLAEQGEKGTENGST